MKRPSSRLMEGVDELRWTLLLGDPALAEEAARHLRSPGQAACEGLSDLISDSAMPAGARVAAVVALKACCQGRPLGTATLRWAVYAGPISVRLAALRALAALDLESSRADLLQALRTDGAWTVRAEALAALAQDRPWPLAALAALSDPHWRVRHALIGHLQAAAAREPDLPERAVAWADEVQHRNHRASGVLRYLGWLPPDAPGTRPANALEQAPWWDEDPPVLRRNLRALPETDLQRDLPLLVELLDTEDEGVRRIAVDALQRLGETGHLLRCLSLLREPRAGNATQAVIEEVLDHLNLDRREELCRAALAGAPGQQELPALAAAWITRQAGAALPTAQEEPALHQRLRALEALEDRQGSCFPSWAAQMDPAAGLPAALSPRARAAALTTEQAEALLRDPAQETSWRVLRRAAGLLHRPLRDFVAALGGPAQIPGGDSAQAEPAQQRPQRHDPATPQLPPLPAVPLGTTGIMVSPMGISGHYGLPESAFEQARQAGVRLFFWEPAYAQQTRYFQGLPPHQRHELVVTCGSFEAEPAALRRDLLRALRNLRLDRVGVFILFWARSPARAADETLEALRGMQREGLAQAVGVSTHRRDLALDLLRRGVPLLMVRHSAAHRGAEREVLPLAHELGTPVFTFSNLCYGRLLAPRTIAGEALPVPTPAQCYRYSLDQPGVTACFSAPRDAAQLDHDLDALRRPSLAAAELSPLLRLGAAVYEDNRRFNLYVRSR